ncbi:hypothetical protein HPB48_022857 [Haemaphysalis longicornis]|uniref:Uncharacterized protein n=1 Tax=Haemaphysalis longicornis TaxID=44386 RepID=A0A9J6FP15_HAELO|nr:hypothetical protein HPB48_022857 [Haemaphysalis longicornis]
MARYEDLVCPLNSVLKAMKMTEVEREAKIVVESLVSTVSANIEREHLAALLGNMSADRTLFHHMHTVYDLNTQTTTQALSFPLRRASFHHGEAASSVLQANLRKSAPRVRQ